MNFNIPYQHRNSSGIYCILNMKNMKVYVGSAVRLSKRFFDHREGLQKQNHRNDKLKKAVLKYGIDNFSFNLLELCEQAELINVEQKWIDRFNAEKLGYNICPVAGSRFGLKVSEETKEKVRVANIGKKQTEETIKKRAKVLSSLYVGEEGKAMREKMAHIAKANKKFTMAGLKQSPETIAKRVLSLKGQKRTPEFCKRLSERQKGKKHSEEKRLANSLAQKGKKLSEEHKLKLSKALKGRPVNQRQRDASRENAKKLLEKRIKNAKVILQISLQGNVLNRWVNTKEAASALSIYPSGISAVCRGITKKYKGFIWRYADTI